MPYHEESKSLQTILSDTFEIISYNIYISVFIYIVYILTVDYDNHSFAKVKYNLL